MKVTVCFGTVKVIVPCGDGTLSVGELTEKAVQRYKKATGRTPEYWVHVHSLASQSEGGILDTDDVLCDVADDREKLTANFEEQDPARTPVVSQHFLGDGTSTCASSVGTASPVNFADLNHTNNSNNKTNIHLTNSNNNGEFDVISEMDVIVTGQESDSKLVVRRGSDPVISPKPEITDNEPNAVVDTNANTLPAKITEKPRSRRGSRDDELNPAFSRFGRDSARQSLSSAHPSMSKWNEAQQKVELTANTEGAPDFLTDGDQDAEIDNIVLTNDGTPLGVHIICKTEQEDGSAFGIVVHSIEPGGRAARDGRLRQGDYILQINGSDISLHTFNRAQEMLREAMRNPTVRLTVQRDKSPTSPGTHTSPTSIVPKENGHLELTIPPPPKSPKTPPAVPVRSPTTALSSPPPPAAGPAEKSSKLIPPMSTRRIGRKLYIQLMKGPQGLGFSVTSRDNPTGGKIPIFIKNILPKGAAIADGRLKPGDRLMEVNGIEMTGKSQSEAVSILRSVKLGGVVNLVVSRQDSPAKMVPRQLPEDAAIEDPTAAHNRVVMTFDIPLNDTGSAGLGVSVKGKTSGTVEENSNKDLGIFIKSVIHGGAASKDGRLRPNDQLLCINETSLDGMSNGEAMETLRTAMSHEKSPRSTIRLVIARRTDVDSAGNPNNLNKPLSSPSGDRNVDSGLVSPLLKKDTIFSNSLPNGPSSQLKNHNLQNGGVHRANEIVVRATVEAPVASRGPGAKVTYPGSQEEVGYGGTRKSSSGQTLPTAGVETVMIEDSQTRLSHPPTSPNQAPHLSTHSSPSVRAPSPPQWLLDWEKTAQDGELSPLPDDNQFDRDSYARASFSERRQGGSLDAKQMAWYKKTKGEQIEPVQKKPPGTVTQRDVAASTSSLLRASSMDSLLDSKPSASHIDESTQKSMGPGLGMEKSSSLESLEVAMATVHQQREDFPGRPRPKVRRGRICNDSFRAAVDRSYQDQPPNGDAITPMYTVVEQEENGGHAIARVPSSGSGDGEMISAGSMKKKKDKKEDKGKTKSSGTGFKGLFRFGKNRKSVGSDSAPKGVAEDSGKDKPVDSQPSEAERLEQDEMERRKARQQAKQEHEKIQEEMQKHREKQAIARQKEESQEALSKAERMMQLRQQYQQRHRDRQGRYVDDDEEDEDDYTRVDPRDRNGYQETVSQKERLEANRAEQRDRRDSRNPERGGDGRDDRPDPMYERLEDDRRKEKRDDPYAERRDYKREDRYGHGNDRHHEDPYADPRSIRHQDRDNRYYDDRSGRRNDHNTENPYEKYNGKRERGPHPQESRDTRYDKRDERPAEQRQQDRRRSIKRGERVEKVKSSKTDDRSRGRDEMDVDRQQDKVKSKESEKVVEKERERRPSERRKENGPEYGGRSDRSTDRRDRRRDDKYDGRRDERYDTRRDDRGDDRYDARKDDRYRERGGGEGDRWSERQDTRPDDRRERSRDDDRYDRYPDQRYRNVQQGERHGYSSLDRPTRRPRGKDPSYYSMSDEVGSRSESNYSRTQDYSRYNNYGDQHQGPRRPSYPNGPTPNHVPYPGGDGDKYRRSKSTSDYLDYREDPRRSKPAADPMDEDYYYDRRSAPSHPRKGYSRPNEVDEERMYASHNDAARV